MGKKPARDAPDASAKATAALPGPRVPDVDQVLAVDDDRLALTAQPAIEIAVQNDEAGG